jgi:hypothetical protein
MSKQDVSALASKPDSHGLTYTQVVDHVTSAMAGGLRLEDLVAKRDINGVVPREDALQIQAPAAKVQ